MGSAPMIERMNSYDREDLLQAARHSLFEPESPPLPLPNMLMMDRVVNINADGGRHGKGEAIAELDINPDLWFFSCHFEGDPVMPGCLGLDGLWQLVGFYLSWSGHLGTARALGVGKVKFRGQVLPSAKKITYHIEIKQLKATSSAMAIAYGVVSVDGSKIYTAEELRVGVFSSLEPL